jgi:hypothetical protein
MKLLHGLMVTSFALSVAACCGGGKAEPSRWDQDNKNKPPSATATTKPAATPTATATVKPTATATAKPEEKKEECKKFATGAVNKAFPDDGTDGFKRVYKADKEGYAEAEYTKGKEKVTVTITHAPDKKGEYSSVSDKVSSFPYKPFGKNKSNVFVKDCYLVAAASQEVDEAKRKSTWLGKVNFSSLP